ncbi:MAG: response regulator [Cellvibrionaceae bacterium]
MSKRETILIVDDDETSVHLLEGLLECSYELVVARNGKQCLELLRGGARPDLVLLDVAMPEVDGYQVCEIIKSDDSLKDIPVVFISALSETEERLKGLSIGADDYLVKPFENEELLAKVRKTLVYAVGQRELQAKLQEANKAVFTALSDSSERGFIVNFVEESHKAQDYAGLASTFFSALKKFGLNGCLQIRCKSGSRNYSMDGLCKPIEEELLERFKGGDRIYGFNTRKVFNYPHVTLLVKNMPIDDEDKDGRYTDHIPIMLSTIDSRVESLEDHHAVVKKKQLEEALVKLSNILEHGASLLEANNEACENTLRTMLQNFELKLPSMGLEEDQEALLVSMLDEGVNTAINAVKESELIGGELSENIYLLKKLSENA